MDISNIMKNMKLINYKFDKEINMIYSKQDNTHQVVELVNIYTQLDKNNISYTIDHNCNFHIINTNEI